MVREMKIEKNIPIPTRSKRDNLKDMSKLMEVGDSILCRPHQANEIAKYLYKLHCPYEHRYGPERLSRKLFALTVQEGNKRRVWRVK